MSEGRGKRSRGRAFDEIATGAAPPARQAKEKALVEIEVQVEKQDLYQDIMDEEEEEVGDEVEILVINGN